jgi:hypothetical protein
VDDYAAGMGSYSFGKGRPRRRTFTILHWQMCVSLSLGVKLRERDAFQIFILPLHSGVSIS